MKARSKSSYLCFLLAIVFLLQAIPINTVQATTIIDSGSGQQHIAAPIEQTPPDGALPTGLRQLYLPLIGNDVSSAAPVTTPTLATPELIQQAFDRGEITEGEQALYLAYALYEPQSLPVQFRSNVGWYGTQYVRQVQDYLQIVRASSPDAIHQELSRMITLAATVCDNEDGPNSFNSAHFHFNYGTIMGGLAIADYVTSMETTFGIEVTQFGWANPPLCTGGATCGGNVNPFGKYPIQIFALGGGLYGYVSGGGGGLYAGFIGDNPNTLATETDALSSCMVLNNDFDQFPEPTAQASLDATTSHEFVHAIQNGYGDPGAREDAMWYESGAAYMEDEIFDSANSDYSYLWPVPTSCLGQWPNNGDPGGISQYSNFLFFRHVAERNGGVNVAGGGENVMQHFWENVGAGQSELDAYNSALVTAGTNLPDAFHKYAIAAKFEKGCTGGYAGDYCLKEGPDYTTFVGNLPPVQGSIAANPGTLNGSIQNNYALNWVSLPTTGSPYKVTLNNTAAGGQLRGSLVCDTGSALTITPFSAVVGTGASTVINAFNASGCTSVVAVITNQQQTAGNPTSCTANSYTLALSNVTNTPTSTNTPTNTPVVSTATATNTPTNTPIAPTATSTNTPTNTPVVPTATATNTPTNTPVAPTATSTNTPTNTPVVPTATSTNTPTNTPIVSTATATNTPTNTPVVPTATATNTPTNTPIAPTATATKTPTPTNTPKPPTATPTPDKVDGQLDGRDDFKTISSTTAPDATYPAQSPKGVVVLRLKAKNEGRSLRNITFHVTKLTQDNYLLNADGGPGQVGSILSVPNSALPGSNQLLDEDEKLIQEFRIGLQSSKRFTFHVDVYAIKVKNVAKTAGSNDATTEELVGSFLLDSDPEAPIIHDNLLFLPLVNK
ncbi:hypothetical protein BH10CHL1_BH10CHL1_25670 [soil metagenome]